MQERLAIRAVGFGLVAIINAQCIAHLFEHAVCGAGNHIGECGLVHHHAEHAVIAENTLIELQGHHRRRRGNIGGNIRYWRCFAIQADRRLRRLTRLQAGSKSQQQRCNQQKALIALWPQLIHGSHCLNP